MLIRACRRAFLQPQRSKSTITFHSCHPITYNPLSRASRCRPQFSEAPSSWHRSFTTARSPIDKLRRAIDKARRDHPILLPTLLIASFASVCWLALLSYDEYTRETPKLGSYPPAVERHLRNAIWYTEVKPEPSIAADSFTKAIEQAEREAMDPFSRECTGIHIRLAAALEKFGQARGAVEVLDRLVNDLLERIEDIDRGWVTPRNRKRNHPHTGEAEALQMGADAEASAEAREIEKNRLLKQVIECKAKISHLYESDFIQDYASSKRVIDEAMKMLLEAMHDPKGLQFDQNRVGISATEAGALLIQAGNSHVSSQDYATALEIFKLALIPVRKATKGKPSCREAFVLSCMHNVVSMMLDSSEPIIDGKHATEAAITEARQTVLSWAQQSRQCAQAVEPTESDEMCQRAILTSFFDTASILTDLGQIKAAREAYEHIIHTYASHPPARALVAAAQSAIEGIDTTEGNR